MFGFKADKIISVRKTMCSDIIAVSCTYLPFKNGTVLGYTYGWPVDNEVYIYTYAESRYGMIWIMDI